MEYRCIDARRVAMTLGLLLGLTAGGCTFDTVGISLPKECGDGVVDGAEDCDTAELAGSSCDSLGFGTGVLACTDSCVFDTSACSNAPICGDGSLDAGEQCDDGNNVAGDGCDALCNTEIPAACGDGNLDAGEACDDGNNTAGDGCDALCNLEIPAACGDGNLDAGEACDDGNNTDCDGCSATCTTETCGNGTLDCGETCETGQVTSDCVAEGFAGGTLGCNGTCNAYDTSACFLQENGQPCTDASQCQGNICYLESEGFPLGFCTSVCVNDGNCPNGVCRDVPGGFRCYPTCNTSADCRPSYYCRVEEWTAADALVCRPLCTSDAECPITGMCNEYTGRCNGTSTGSGDNGTACNDRNDCLGTACLNNVNNGYCASLCDVTNPNCPGDSICSDNAMGTVGDIGFCMDGCQSQGDCTRSEVSCVSNPWGQNNICWL